MEQTGFIACVDFGTSNITGLLGRRNEQDVISIIASESISSDSCVKHGIVYNIDEAAGKFKRLLSLLENKVGKKIGRVYVSIAGMSLKAIEHIQTQTLIMETPVTFVMLDQMEQQARLNRLSLLTNYSVVAPEIFLNSKLEEDPIGKPATTIEARYRLIAGRPNIKANLKRTITDKNNIDVAGYVVGPVATGAILLDEEEKKQGCALVDFGGGTTTVSVYKSGLLRYMTVIPFGGRTITRDIQSLGLPFDTAESCKIRYGKVGKEKVKAENKSFADASVDMKELNKVIQLRQEEIVLNVLNQIKESGYAEELEAGIIITGGASQMRGMIDYLAEKSRMPVKNGSIKRLYINNAIDLLQNPSYAQCLGLMLYAKENCEKVEIPKPEPKPEPQPQVQPVVDNTGTQEETTQTQPQPEVRTDKTKESGRKNNNDKNSPKQKSIFDFLQKVGGTLFNDEK